MNWYYAEQGQQMGPVPEEQLYQLFQAGRINQDTLVWREGLADWMPYRQAMAQSNPAAGQPPGQAPTTGGATATGLGESEVVCAECGRMFPASETVRFGKACVCAACKPVFLQKLSEGAKINTGEVSYAGFWIRFAANFLDALILVVPLVILLFAILIPAAVKGNGESPILAIAPFMMQITFPLLLAIYQTIFVGKFGATPGKMLCRIHVVTANGERMTYARAAGRGFARILSDITCDIGYIIAAFDTEKRALHDHICNTRVIYK